MKILLTNDDGVTSPGLHAAYKSLTADGHTVTVVAPDRQRSGQSHSVNLYTSLKVTEVEMPDGAPGYMLDGAPADCAHFGCLALAKEPVDLVVSGINTDTNLGYDANYSGTVGAALEAAAMGCPALAMSLDTVTEPDWPKAGALTAQAVRLFPGWKIPDGLVVNINIPARITAPEWIWAPLNITPAREYYQVETSPDGDKLYKRTRDEENSFYSPGTDVDYFKRGRVTLSPLGPVRSERQTLIRMLKMNSNSHSAAGDRVQKRVQKSF